MAFLAAVRRAASPLLLTAADTTPAPLLLTAAAAATTTTTSPLLLTSNAEGRAAAATSTTFPLLLTVNTEVRAAAATSSPLLLTGATSTTTTATISPLAGAFSSPAILSRAAALSTYFSSPGTLHRRLFSTSLLGHRKSVSAPIYLSTAGSRLASRGMCTEALTPVVKKELERIEKEAVARQQEFIKELEAFEREIMSLYSVAKLSNDETALTAGKVAWRVSTAVLAFGIATLVTVLQVVKDGWKLEFQEEVKRLLEEMVEKMKGEIVAHLRQLVRKELEIIEAEKAAAAGRK